MSMSRKDFVEIARSLKEMRQTMDEKVVDAVARKLATCLDRMSSTFQPQRFLDACGVKDGSSNSF